MFFFFLVLLNFRTFFDHYAKSLMVELLCLLHIACPLWLTQTRLSCWEMVAWQSVAPIMNCWETQTRSTRTCGRNRMKQHTWMRQLMVDSFVMGEMWFWSVVLVVAVQFFVVVVVDGFNGVVRYPCFTCGVWRLTTQDTSMVWIYLIL